MYIDEPRADRQPSGIESHAGMAVTERTYGRDAIADDAHVCLESRSCSGAVDH